MVRLFLVYAWATSFTVSAFTSSHVNPCCHSKTRTPFVASGRRSPALSAASRVMDLDDTNRHEILAGPKTVLIKAYATWCGPCRLVEPVVDRCAEKWAGKVEIVKYDVNSDNISGLQKDMLLQNVEISTIPALILYNNERVVTTRSGLINDEQLDMFLETNLKSAVGARQTQEDSVSPKQNLVDFLYGRDVQDVPNMQQACPAGCCA